MNISEIVKYSKFILRRFFWAILLTFAVFVVIGYFYITSNPRIYRSTSIIKVSQAPLSDSQARQYTDVNVLTRLNKSISKIATQSTTLDIVRGLLGEELSDSYFLGRVRVFPYPDMDLIEVTGMDTTPESAQKISNALADAVVTRHQQLESETPTGTVLQIIQKGRAPSAPSSVPRKTIFILWSVCSLLASTIFWTYIFFLDRRIESEEDIVHLFKNYTVITSIPIFSKKMREKSFIIDQYQTITSFLSSSSLTNEKRAIAIVSSSKGEGKTVTAANIALSFSILGKKVVLFDLDTRRPTIHRLFKVENKEDSYSRAIIRDTKLPKPTLVDNTEISLYPAGRVQDWEYGRVFTSNRISEIIDEHSVHENEWLIFDTPPVLSLTSVTAALKQIKNVVLVVRLRKTKKSDLGKTINLISREKVNIIGIIAIGSERKEVKSYYSREAA